MNHTNTNYMKVRVVDRDSLEGFVVVASVTVMEEMVTTSSNNDACMSAIVNKASNTEHESR